MDQIFDGFKAWVRSKNDSWKKQGVNVNEIYEAMHAHQIHVNLQSEVGYGHIGLYESNNIYWVEFEATARNLESYYKYIEFERLPDFQDLEVEYLNFLTSTD